MASLTNERRAIFLQALGLRAAHAETTEPRDIFPVPEHLRALEAEVVLVIGDRGSGKTQLKKALTTPKIREALVPYARGIRVPSESNWLQGWPLESGGPDLRGWRELLSTNPGKDDLIAIWLAYLLRTMKLQLSSDEVERTAELHQAPAADARSVLAAYQKIGVTVTTVLDALDDRMLQQQQCLFVAYDELDTIFHENWQAMGAVIRGLVSFWAAYARRWKRLRPKIFLRSDFYKHHRAVAGADVAKLAGNRVELQWSDKNLYGALLKHILNKTDANGDLSLRSYFALTVATRSDPVLGEIPVLGKAEEAKPFVNRLISEYMGANRGKGASFRWILDHLRDGNGHALPRSLVQLIELAAEIERDQPRASGAHLLHHVSIRNALDRLSTEYVLQAQTHEFPWLDGLGRRLSKEREVPWKKRELIRLLSQDFAGAWSETGARPPGADPEELLENLVELGVLRARGDELLDVPDLYLHGLNLRRKGGVAKK